MIQTFLTHAPLDLNLAQAFVQAHDCGAIIHFLGTVRNHNLGLKVNSLEYAAYEPMAEKLLNRMAVEAKEKFQVERVYLAHRLGHLAINDASVLISVSSHHRDASYLASRYLIETLKKDLPVWKKEHYEGQTPSWVQCSHHHHA